MSAVLPVRFGVEDAQKASDEWGFNCGPGALCAVLDLTPAELRPHLGDFEQKRYTNPTMMSAVLYRVGAKASQVYRSDDPRFPGWPKLQHGLVRVQWGGPWTKPGVPMAARYRKTHWIAMRKGGAEVFDINALEWGGWLPLDAWCHELVPWLCADCGPQWDGTAWPTHALEVAPKS